MIASLSEITQLWDRSLRKIEEQMGEKQVFDTFFANSYIYDIEGSTITVVVKSQLALSIITTKYIDLVKSVVNELTDSSYEIEFVLEETARNRSKEGPSPVKAINKQEYFADAKLDPSLTFDNFVVGDFNGEASQAASLIASNPGKMFNPLFIHSESGLGKTHLLNAIGNYILKEKNPNAKILYISTDEFVDTYINFVTGGGEKASQSLRDYFKTVDVLLLDDVQMIKDKVKTEEMLFFVYQHMINNNKQIVITSDRQPAELSGLEKRLVTRFSQGLVVKINEPDQNTCVNILRKKIVENGLDINNFDDNVLYFFADKFSKNVRELEGALNRLIFIVGLNKNEKVTMDFAVNAVSSIVSGKQLETQLNEQKIINVVADYYSLAPSQLTGKVRTGQIALARHIAMYLIRNMLDVPLKKIGDMFGGKDHTTVMSAISKVDKELKTDDNLKAAVEELQKRLK